MFAPCAGNLEVSQHEHACRRPRQSLIRAAESTNSPYISSTKSSMCPHPRSPKTPRHHLHDGFSSVQKEMVRKLGRGVSSKVNNEIYPTLSSTTLSPSSSNTSRIASPISLVYGAHTPAFFTSGCPSSTNCVAIPHVIPTDHAIAE
jgi:hypothetical protein